MDSITKARGLALLVPAGLIAGALVSQYIGGLFPCEMCHWQRWPHYAAICLAVVAYLFRQNKAAVAFVALAALALLISGVIGVFHAGVEYKWWRGITDCANMAGSGSITDILKAPTVSCDQPQWTLGPISLAGFNALISIPAGLLILGLLAKKRRSL